MKLAITVQNGSLAGKRVFLTGEHLTVGRSENCDLMFDLRQDRIVSSKHAYIENKPDGFYLVDNESTNGTFVNGEQIKRIHLKNNDRIQFGKNGPEATVSIEGTREQQPAFQNQFQSPAINQQFQPPPQHQQANWRNSVVNFGLQNFDVKPQQSQSKKHLGMAITIWILVFLSLPIVTFMIVGNLGIVPAFIAAVVAFVPAIFYLLPLLLLDRYDPEPPWALAMAFAWGALVSVLFSAVVNDLVAYTVASSFGNEAGQLASGIFSAPIFEEASKGLGVLLFLIFLRKEFDDILDGIVYAGTIALGFATVENVLYYGRGLLDGGFPQLAVLFFLRGVLSPFAHVTFTAMIGIGCGISRESHNLFVRVFMPFLGYLCAVGLHMIWNGMAFLGGLGGFLLGYLILEIPFFLIFIGFSGYIMHRQNKILREMLAIDVARGLITQEQLDTVTSVFKSTAWLLGSIFTEKYRARRKFLRAVGKLGLSYWHIQRATAAQGQTASFQQNPILREEVLQWRDKV
jgi:protease PrsW